MEDTNKRKEHPATTPGDKDDSNPQPSKKQKGNEPQVDKSQKGKDKEPPTASTQNNQTTAPQTSFNLRERGFKVPKQQTQELILKSIRTYTSEIKEKEAIISSIDQAMYGHFAKQAILKSGAPTAKEEVTYYTAIWSKVEITEWAQVKPMMGNYDEDSSFIVPDEKLLIAAYSSRQDRDEVLKNAIELKVTWKLEKVDTLNEEDCVPQPTHLAYMPIAVDEEQLRDASPVPIRSVKKTSSGNGVTVALFTDKDLKTLLDGEEVRIGTEKIPIYPSYASEGKIEYKLWLGSIPKNVKKSQVEKQLKFFGVNYKEVDMIRAPSGQHRGCAFVTFEQPNDLVEARKAAVWVEDGRRRAGGSILKWDTPRKGFKSIEEQGEKEKEK